MPAWRTNEEWSLVSAQSNTVTKHIHPSNHRLGPNVLKVVLKQNLSTDYLQEPGRKNVVLISLAT